MQIEIECRNIIELPAMLREIASQIELTGLDQGVSPKWRILKEGEGLRMSENQYDDLRDYLQDELDDVIRNSIGKLRDIVLDS